MILLFIRIAEQLHRALSFKSHAYWSLYNEFNGSQMSLNELYIYVLKGEVHYLTFIAFVSVCFMSTIY